MTRTTSRPLPMIVDVVEVVRAERLSPSFVRVQLGGACLADFGVEGELYDQRIKLVFPSPGHALPADVLAGESWYDSWLEQPADERGHMRTYSVREVVGEGADTRVVVDLVVHGVVHEDSGSGPGSAWAQGASVGDRVLLVGPRRGQRFGGIEFGPGAARRLLLAGDETAVPAACAILGQLPWSATGAAFLEVPESADVQTIPHPSGVEVVWLPRDGAPLGERLRVAVLDHLGVSVPVSAGPLDAMGSVDPDLWETPTYSSSGEETDAEVCPVGRPLDDLYAWIAGECGVVTGLRRVLVKDLGMDRRQVAFMGYWRRGVAMRS